MGGADPAAGDGVLRLVLRWDAAPDAEPEQVERSGRRLRSELQELDVDDVTVPSGGEAPAGSKGVDTGVLGELLITMSASGGVFATVVATVRSWLARRDDATSVKLTVDGDTLELSRANAAERADLIQAFISNHQRS